MRYRKSKDTDQEESEKVYEMLKELFDSHPEIEPNIWAAAFMSTVANSFKESEVSYDEYKSEMMQAIKFYKRYWDEMD